MGQKNAIVRLNQHVSLAYPGELQGDQLEALGLETLDDLADQSTLDSVRLDHDEGAFLVGRHFLAGGLFSWCRGDEIQMGNENWNVKLCAKKNYST